MSEFETLGTMVRRIVANEKENAILRNKKEARKRIEEARSLDESARYYCGEQIRLMLGLREFPSSFEPIIPIIIGYYNDDGKPVFASIGNTAMKAWHLHEYEDQRVSLTEACTVHLFAYDIEGGLYLHSRSGHNGVYACSICPEGLDHYRLSPHTLGISGLADYLEYPGVSGDWDCQACRLLGKKSVAPSETIKNPEEGRRKAEATWFDTTGVKERKPCLDLIHDEMFEQIRQYGLKVQQEQFADCGFITWDKWIGDKSISIKYYDASIKKS